MKILICFLASIIFISPAAHTQVEYGSFIKFNSEVQRESLNSFSSVDEAGNIIQNIIAVIGLKPKFEIREANIPNAAAVIYHSKRYILYNASFVSSLNKIAGNKWASVSILAHEIGHHLNGHTLEAGGGKPEMELEADEFSGFVLKRMGASLQEAQVAMKIAAGQKASHTHPAQGDRLYAIAKGWNAANNQVSGKNTDVALDYSKPETEPLKETRLQIKTEQTSKAVLAEKYILKDVHFINDQSADYYITTRSHLVKTDGNIVNIIGTVVSNQSENYPLLIVDARKNFWFINKYGSIVTETGKKIGYLSNHN